MSHPQSYEILLVPEFDESGSAVPAPGTAIRSGVVAATGQTGSSGYPRYAGDGIVADIDPVTRTVEALLVDGAELYYSLSVRIAERPGGVTGGTTDDEAGDEAGDGPADEQGEQAGRTAWPAGEPAELTEEPAGRADEPGEGRPAHPARERAGRTPEPPDEHRDQAS